MPVILAGRRREMRRNRDELRAVEREDPIELGKADVVTHRQPELPVLGVGDDGLVARLFRLRLAVDDTADLDVEEMDLAIRRDDLARRLEYEARVRALLAAVAQLDDRAAHERDPVRARPSRHRGDGLAAAERLGPRGGDRGG